MAGQKKKRFFIGGEGVCMEFILNDKVILKNIQDSRVQEEIKQHLTCFNPQYKTLQRLGKWTGGIPEKLKFYEQEPDTPDTLICPRGFADRAYRICRMFNEEMVVMDERRELDSVDMAFRGTLRPFQEEAVSGPLLKETHGVLSAGTGSGKTVIALYIIAQRRQPALVVVHTVELLHQWQDRIGAFLDIPLDEIGVIGGGKFRIGEKISVGLYQSIRKKVPELNPLFGHLVVDECHKCPSKTFTEAVAGFEAKYRLGLTATGYRRDGLGDLIFMTLGELRHTIEKAPLVANGDLCSAHVICRKTAFETTLDASVNYPSVMKALAQDEPRNELICRDIASEKSKGIKLILTDRRKHAQTIQSMLEKKYGLVSNVLTGTTARNERETIVKDLQQGKISILIATGQLIGEGFDLPELSVLFLVTPIKFRGRLIQYVGRILRPSKGKTEGVIYDYVDVNVGVLHTSAAVRIETYRQEQIEVDCDLLV